MDITALELLFRDMYESLSELSLVLDNEYTALSEQNLENLQQAAIDKDRLSEKLDELEKNRYHILENTSFNLDRISMQLFIQQNFPGDDHALLKLWDMIAELAKTCEKQNSINGIIIENKKQQTNDAISILQTGELEQTELYDAEGASVGPAYKSTVVRA